MSKFDTAYLRADRSAIYNNTNSKVAAQLLNLSLCFYQSLYLVNSELIEAESKNWHAHPVWFLDNNPTVGNSEQKNGIRLMFWSGADFNEEKLNIKGKKFKDASTFYNNITELKKYDLFRWLKKSREI